MPTRIHIVYQTQTFLSETVSPKTHGQGCLDIKYYQDALLFSFTATKPTITTDINTATNIEEQIYYP